jgi:hypothetical protein
LWRLRAGLSRLGDLPRSGRSGKVAELYHQKRGLLQVGIKQAGKSGTPNRFIHYGSQLKKPGLANFSLGSLISSRADCHARKFFML